MTVVLAIEIACALAACGALLALMAQAVRLNRKSKEQPADRIERLHRRHRSIGFVLLAAGIVHGISATIYASGARTETYVMGWASIVLFALSGICMAPPVRARLPPCGRYARLSLRTGFRSFHRPRRHGKAIAEFRLSPNRLPSIP